MPESHTTDPATGAQLASWRKSSFSQYEACVTVAELPGGVGVRDSKQPDAGTLFLSRRQFGDWVAGIRAGEFDDLM